ncbi:MAG: metal ABC transporter permease [Candidatus Babeliales bacterium]
MVNTQLIYGLMIAFCIGSIAAYIGSLMLTKRATLMAGALGHLTFPGIAIALRYHFDIYIGAVAVLIIGITIIWFLEKETAIPVEAVTAIIFTSSTSLAFLFLPEHSFETALLGNIANLSGTVTILTLASALISLGIVHYIFKPLILMSISTGIAQSCGYSVQKYNFIYLTLIALIVVLSIRIVGGLMTVALIAIPASTSRNVSSNLQQYRFLSVTIGALSCLIGFLISFTYTISIGPAVILSNSFLFFISLVIHFFVPHSINFNATIRK